MSSHYSAGQFNDAFRPTRLGNWQKIGDRDREIGRRPNLPWSTRTTTTQFIADDRGHLLPNTIRNACSSPWGVLKDFVLEQELEKKRLANAQADHERLVNMSPKNLNNLANRKLLQPKSKFSRRPVDHIMLYLKEMKLPVIWIIGPPTRKIYKIRKTFSTQLATKFNFAYVNLDDEIEKWRGRQFLALQNEDDRSDLCYNMSQRKDNARRVEKIYYGTSLAKQYFRDINVFLKVSKAIETNNGEKNSDAVTKMAKSCRSTRQRINFNLANVFTVQKILEMLKFAMMENLPAKGFVIDGIPYDIEEAVAFEKYLYPCFLGLYFCEGAGFYREFRRQEHKMKSGQSLKTVRVQEPVAFISKLIKRIKPFSYLDTEKVSNVFGHKIIRVIHSEDIDQDTIDYINHVVAKNLENYPKLERAKSRLTDYLESCPMRSKVNTASSVFSHQNGRRYSTVGDGTKSKYFNESSTPTSQRQRKYPAPTTPIARSRVSSALEDAKNEMIKILDGKVEEVLREMRETSKKNEKKLNTQLSSRSEKTSHVTEKEFMLPPAENPEKVMRSESQEAVSRMLTTDSYNTLSDHEFLSDIATPRLEDSFTKTTSTLTQPEVEGDTSPMYRSPRLSKKPFPTFVNLKYANNEKLMDGQGDTVLNDRAIACDLKPTRDKNRSLYSKMEYSTPSSRIENPMDLDRGDNFSPIITSNPTTKHSGTETVETLDDQEFYDNSEWETDESI